MPAPGFPTSFSKPRHAWADAPLPTATASVSCSITAATGFILPTATRCAIEEDDIAKRKRELDRPAVKLRAYGPQSRREFFSFLKLRDGEPG